LRSIEPLEKRDIAARNAYFGGLIEIGNVAKPVFYPKRGARELPSRNWGGWVPPFLWGLSSGNRKKMASEVRGGGVKIGVDLGRRPDVVKKKGLVGGLCTLGGRAHRAGNPHAARWCSINLLLDVGTGGISKGDFRRPLKINAY